MAQHKRPGRTASVKEMRLSEAIQEGAKLVPQHFGWYTGVTNEVWSTCAIGAACQVVFDASPMELHIHHVDLADLQAVYHDIPDAIFDEIVERNDTFFESRESIADWLESIGY